MLSIPGTAGSRSRWPYCWICFPGIPASLTRLSIHPRQPGVLRLFRLPAVPAAQAAARYRPLRFRARAGLLISPPKLREDGFSAGLHLLNMFSDCEGTEFPQPYVCGWRRGLQLLPSGNWISTAGLPPISRRHRLRLHVYTCSQPVCRVYYASSPAHEVLRLRHYEMRPAPPFCNSRRSEDAGLLTQEEHPAQRLGAGSANVRPEAIFRAVNRRVTTDGGSEERSISWQRMIRGSRGAKHRRRRNQLGCVPRLHRCLLPVCPGLGSCHCNAQQQAHLCNSSSPLLRARRGAT